MSTSPSDRRPVELHIPALTLFKVFLAALLIGLIMKLIPLLMMLFMAVLVAVTLAPVLGWVQRRGAPRWLGITLLVLGIAGSLAVFFAVILPSMVDQISEFIKNFPKLRAQTLDMIPEGVLHNTAAKVFRGEVLPGQSPWMTHLMSAGQLVAGGVFSLFVILILALYLVVDGPNTYRWLTAFFSPKHRMKIHQTSGELSQVIFAYVAGQAITSALVFVISLIVLGMLHVPAALTLAVLAGIFDVLPVLGLVLSAGPAVLLALTVSPTTALIVLGFYLFYHALESYFIVPKVYGDRLRLSTLTVIISLLAADLIAGIPGAIAVLPVVASYPIIERIWLARYLQDSTIEKHAVEDEDTKAGA